MALRFCPVTSATEAAQRGNETGIPIMHLPHGSSALQRNEISKNQTHDWLFGNRH